MDARGDVGDIGQVLVPGFRGGGGQGGSVSGHGAFDRVAEVVEQLVIEADYQL
ncbi:hypothetical protein [Nocardia sp. alder85J]|uniref:hypothetical protein n=1 Tax=Nocardia sp. alder85J TaxID=2862949 RepID=UPI001CD1F32A|nr:hypothetical protein [Nocardia sp. alder85J]MCX4097905.1 hypothetical protein [Nocardia sp. alder85J]